jgi:hypothetical protein
LTEWSDGKIRSERYHGDNLQAGIQEFFETAREENLLALRWDNEYLREERDRQRAETKLKAMTAATGA